jgi:hypothetical protein
VALYKGAVQKASPLRVQVTAPTTGSIFVVGYSAFGENTLGASSRPILTRPSIAGSGRGVAIPMRPPGNDEGIADPVAEATVVTVFRSPPTVPPLTIGSYNLPISIRWEAPLNSAVVVGHGASILLYALTNGDHTWSGDITWEEK